MIKIGIIGGSGYAGGEIIRILSRHENVEIKSVTSRKYADEYLYRAHPNLRGVTDLKFEELEVDKITKKCDLVFTSLPHGVIAKEMRTFYETGIRIIDLSADYRLNNPQDYDKWYGYEHPDPELLEKFVYGVPEIYRDKIRESRTIASPGCMAVTSILSLLPFIKNKVINHEYLVVDSKIGSSGGGNKPNISTHHSERYGVVRPYKPVSHRHTAEIEQELSLAANNKVNISMSPHAVNIVRGILCTIHAFPIKQITTGEVWKMLRECYKDELFIRFIKDRKGIHQYPDPKMVIGSNYCDIGFEIDQFSGRLVILAATDNLIKGAAGSAVQCMNVMMKYPEIRGLDGIPLHPV